MDSPPRHAVRSAVLETRAVLAKADAVYAPFSCPGTAECCQLAVTGREPWLWPSELELLREALRRQGRALPPARADGACPFLDASGKRCSVYAERPFGCRTFFCHRIQGPARQPIEDTNALLERLAALNLVHWPEASPQPLRALHALALASAVE